MSSLNVDLKAARTTSAENPQPQDVESPRRGMRMRKLAIVALAIASLLTTAHAADSLPPVSQAQRIAVKRTAQLTEVKWQPVLPDTMPSRRGFFSGDPQTGVPYSSARGVGRWIGFDVSLETFMTAVQNPKSVLYTEDLREAPYEVPNAATYYGLTCSSFVQYAFRDDLFWGTRLAQENPERANMTLRDEQGAHGVELADILNSAPVGSHMEMVTDITYSADGEVASIELTDIVYGGPRRRTFTPPQFDAYLKRHSYLVYRYNYTDSVSYTPSKYVAIGVEEVQEVVYNEVLALDRGNKTNYVKDTPVKFNIMDENAVALVVWQNGRKLESESITAPGVVERRYSGCGRYSAHCLMRDGSTSDPVEFMVAELVIDAPDTVEPGTEFTVEFSAEGCVPRYVLLQPRDTFGIRYWRPLTETEVSEGSVSLAHDDPGSFYVVVNGVNDFGGVYSNRKPVTLTK